MQARAASKRTGYIAIGGVGVALGAAYLGFALELSVGTLDQPGAAVFPIAVGVLMILVSLASIWKGWKLDRSEQVEFPTGADLKRLLGLVALLLAYFVALPWLGQLVASALFGAVLIRLLSDGGWGRSFLSGTVMAGLLYAVFVTGFKVAMPQGLLGF